VFGVAEGGRGDVVVDEGEVVDFVLFGEVCEVEAPLVGVVELGGDAEDLEGLGELV